MDTATTHLCDRLQAAAELLGNSGDRLRQDVATICKTLGRSAFRIVVFGPFNYGKSTLLNALLGELTVPIDLIPSTGAAICIRSGSETRTRITLTDGQIVDEAGTEVLKGYAVLDAERRMRSDVSAVDVVCPHPLLQQGIELVDLPGTNDRQAQDELVKHQLLSADLVVQVLDGRKLMTLGEREHLRDWLSDRGIETVVFVVNFLNLLAPKEQQDVMNRMRFVASSFRSELPDGVSNLYRVDALPALRARLKGQAADLQSTTDLQTSGLAAFEAALQTIVEDRQQEGSDSKLPRLMAIAQEVQDALQQRMAAIAAHASEEHTKRQRKRDIQAKARSLILQGFEEEISRLKAWLQLDALVQQYRTDAAEALKQFDLSTWQRFTLQPEWQQRSRHVMDWVQKSCDFFVLPAPPQLQVEFPNEPEVNLPGLPGDRGTNDITDNTATTAAAAGLGFLLGGPIGAAMLGGVNYVLNPRGSDPSESTSIIDDREDDIDRAYTQAATYYLQNFGLQGLKAIYEYELAVDPLLNPADITSPYPKPSTPTPTAELATYQSVLDALVEAIADCPDA